MSDACFIEVDRRIQLYSGYRSYATEESLYQTLVVAASATEETEGEEEVEKVIVDSFAARVGQVNIKLVWQLMSFKKVIAIMNLMNVVLQHG